MSAKRPIKKMKPLGKTDRKTFKDTTTKDVRGAEDQENIALVEKLSKKRSSSDFDDDDADAAVVPVGTGFQSMLEQFGSDISKAMQAKKKRLETLTNNYMKGSQHKLEQLWRTHQNQRQKLTQQYSQQVSAALQQWEAEAQRGEEQEERMNNLFKQQLKVLQQARAAQGQKLKAVRELYDVFVKNMEEMQKSHDSFLQKATEELRKEMNVLQKKILMDTQQQEMANVRKSLTSMLF
ncbi:synaptonemal complex protein 3-like [Boleophthalmus pectinirostris]|uniref:synaptonemal complex protein 3-like n=1 Tax=Boleophthalmus pectinirostris TaxID=150288 RepID=UPI00242FD4EF|nr:synaptonemal complex protein 3-like [Boleophthalmus pectinirostris]